MSDFLYILHMLGIAMGLGTGFVMIALEFGTKDMAPEEKGPFMMRAMVASKVSLTGLVLLLVTGLILMIPMLSDLLSSPLFLIKMALVVVLVVLEVIFLGLQARVKQERGGPAQARIPGLGRVMTITATLIVIVAVLVFH